LCNTPEHTDGLRKMAAASEEDAPRVFWIA